MPKVSLAGGSKRKETRKPKQRIWKQNGFEGETDGRPARELRATGKREHRQWMEMT